MNNKENIQEKDAGSNTPKDSKEEAERRKLVEVNKKDTISEDELEEEKQYHEAQTERD